MKTKLLLGLVALLIIPYVFALNAVDVQPENPYTNDNLTCSVNATGSFLYKWYVDGENSGITSYKVDSSLTSHYQNWRCYVETYIPRPGYIPIGEDSVTILNTAPVLQSINDLTVNETDLAAITPNASDIDNDSLTYTYLSPLNSSGQWLTDYSSAGTHNVNVTVSDGNLTDTKSFTITVNNVNRQPNITSVTAPNGSEGSQLSLSFTASDPDTDDTLSYEIRKNGTVVSSSSLYNWTPSYTSAGTYNFTFIVNDGKGGSDSESRIITISNTNSAPNITSVNAPLSVIETQLLSVSFTAADADGDSMAYRIMKNGTVVSNSSSYSWTTNYSSEGSYNFTFFVNDTYGASDTEYRIINVTRYNRAPSITNITAPNGSEGDTLDFSFTAADSDGDSISYTIKRSGTVVSNSSSYSWTANYTSAGTYSFEFIAGDGIANSTASRTVVINNTNRKPAITNVTINPSTAYTNTILTCNGTYADLDNEAESGSSYRWFKNLTEISAATSKTLAGAYFSKSDSIICEYKPKDGIDFGNATNSTAVVILNSAPYFNPSLQNKTISENSTLTYQINCSDADSDTLAYSSNSTQWTINSSTGAVSWTADFDDSGYYTYAVNCSDGTAAASGTFAINVTDVNSAPAANITSPADSSTFESGESITFAGTGADFEDGALAGNNLVWTSNASGNFGNGTSVNCSNLSLGSHTITLTAKDSAGLNATDTIHITIVPYVAKTGNAVINEFMAYATSGDWVEIYNNDSVSVDISGWRLNDTLNTSSMDIIPSGTILDSGEFYISDVGNRLNRDDERIYLINSSGSVIDNYNYSSSIANISTGRFPDGTNNWQNLTVPTPGEPNAYGTRIIDSTINGTVYNGYYDSIPGITLYLINISTISGPAIHVNLSYITNSNIINSTVDNCTISDSTLTNSPCRDAVIDPSTITNSDTTGSTVINSTITDSNATYSTVNNSEIEDSDVNGSVVEDSSWIIGGQVQDSDITNSTVGYTEVNSSNISESKASYSSITNSNISNSEVYTATITNSIIENSNLSIGFDNIIIENANITNGVLVSGNLTWNSITTTGPASLTDIIDYRPSADFTYKPSHPEEGEEVAFMSTSTDVNIGGDLNDSLICNWKFNDGYEATECNTTHSYSDKGDYEVILTVTDAYNKSDLINKTITVSKKSTTNDGGSSGGGGGSVLSTSVYSVSLTEEGESKLLKENDKIKFSFDEEYHYVTLMEIKSGSADIKVESTPVVSSINLAETKEFDLNNDSSNDLAVTLNEILSNTAKITVKLIAKEKEETNETSETNESQEEIQPEKENNATETKETTKKETKAEEGWADYAEEQPSQSVFDKAVNWCKDSFEYCWSKTKAGAVYTYHLPYAKYIAAGIAILIIIIIIITLSIRGKNSILPKLGSLVTAFFFEDDKLIDNKKRKKTK